MSSLPNRTSGLTMRSSSVCVGAQRYEKKWRHIRERTLLLGKLRGFLDYEAASALRPSFPAPAWLKGRLRDSKWGSERPP